MVAQQRTAAAARLPIISLCSFDAYSELAGIPRRPSARRQSGRSAHWCYSRT
jgi:hypothetical protein